MLLNRSNLEKGFVKFFVQLYPRQKIVNVNRTGEKSVIFHHPLERTEEYHQLAVFKEGLYNNLKDQIIFSGKYFIYGKTACLHLVKKKKAKQACKHTRAHLRNHEN